MRAVSAATSRIPHRESAGEIKSESDPEQEKIGFVNLSPKQNVPMARCLAAKMFNIEGHHDRSVVPQICEQGCLNLASRSFY
jgi:hypothetical protein